VNKTTSTASYAFIGLGILCLIAAPVLLILSENELNLMRQMNARSELAGAAPLDVLENSFEEEIRESRAYDSGLGAIRNGLVFIGIGLVLRRLDAVLATRNPTATIDGRIGPPDNAT
jgi:uncharacterized membrane protein YccC